MALTGQRVDKVKINCDSSHFHEFWTHRQLHISGVTPTTIKNVQTLEGEVGCVGGVHFWNYFLDGKDWVVKTVITNIDKENKSITYKIIEGDLMELYKTYVVNIRVEKEGSHIFVIWTTEYEKLRPNVPDPDYLGDFYTKLSKDIEAHCLQC